MLRLDEELNGRYYTTVKFPIVLSDRTLLAGYTIDITERRQAEDALRASLARVERFHAQMIALSQMSQMLLSCEDRLEAYEVIARSGAELFKGASGGLAVHDGSASQLRLAAQWGRPLLPAAFQAQDCWALRRGAPHEVAEAAPRVPCRHFLRPPEAPCLCLPLSVRGEPLGLLHVGTSSGQDGASFEDLRLLALKVGGVIELALSNLALQETLRAQAIRDPLTGLFNRRFLDESLARELLRRRRTGEPLVVAMLDLDHFKHFNDTYGHEAGDLVLQAVGALLLRSTRTSDLACRYGGEELTLVLPRATLDDARVRLEALRQAVAELRVPYQGGELPAITVSIGAVAARPAEQDAPAVLGRADAELYRAKHQGRNRVVVAESPLALLLERGQGLARGFLLGRLLRRAPALGQQRALHPAGHAEASAGGRRPPRPAPRTRAAARPRACSHSCSALFWSRTSSTPPGARSAANRRATRRAAGQAAVEVERRQHGLERVGPQGLLLAPAGLLLAAAQPQQGRQAQLGGARARLRDEIRAARWKLLLPSRPCGSRWCSRSAVARLSTASPRNSSGSLWGSWRSRSCDQLVWVRAWSSSARSRKSCPSRAASSHSARARSGFIARGPPAAPHGQADGHRQQQGPHLS